MKRLYHSSMISCLSSSLLDLMKERRKSYFSKARYLDYISNGDGKLHLLWFIFNEYGLYHDLRLFISLTFLQGVHLRFERELNYSTIYVNAGTSEFLLNSDGLFSRGTNLHGELGLSIVKGGGHDQFITEFQQVKEWRLSFSKPAIPINNDELITVSTSSSHSLLLTTKGVFGCGSNEHHQLWLNNDSDRDPEEKLSIYFHVNLFTKLKDNDDDSDVVLSISCTHGSSLILTRDKGLMYYGRNPSYVKEDAVCYDNDIWNTVNQSPLVQISVNSHNLTILKRNALFHFCPIYHDHNWPISCSFNIIETITNDLCTFLLDSNGRLYWTQCNDGGLIHPINNLPLKKDEKIRLICGADAHFFIHTTMNRLFLCKNSVYARECYDEDFDQGEEVGTMINSMPLYIFEEIKFDQMIDDKEEELDFYIEQMLYVDHRYILMIISTKGDLWSFTNCFALFRGKKCSMNLTKINVCRPL